MTCEVIHLYECEVQRILLFTLGSANTWLPAVTKMVCRMKINHLDYPLQPRV